MQTPSPPPTARVKKRIAGLGGGLLIQPLPRPTATVQLLPLTPGGKRDHRGDGKRTAPAQSTLPKAGSAQVRCDTPARTPWSSIHRSRFMCHWRRELGLRRQVVTAETKVGDSARVCLSANPAAFTITAPTGACSTQSVTSGTANHWSWTVTPLRAGTGLLQVQVTALFAGMPGKVEFDSTYSVVVRVAPRPLLTRVTDFLKSWEGILTSLAASAAAVAGILKLFRREPSNPTG